MKNTRNCQHKDNVSDELSPAESITHVESTARCVDTTVQYGYLVERLGGEEASSYHANHPAPHVDRARVCDVIYLI